MRLEPILTWWLEGGRLDHRLVPLLSALARTQSLTGAAGEVGISSHMARKVLRDCEAICRGPLVEARTGVGTTLSPLAVQILKADLAASAAVAPILAPLSFELHKSKRGKVATRRKSR